MASSIQTLLKRCAALGKPGRFREFSWAKFETALAAACRRDFKGMPRMAQAFAQMLQALVERGAFPSMLDKFPAFLLASAHDAFTLELAEFRGDDGALTLP